MSWQELAEPELLRVMLVFCRIGAALMVVPGFGEVYVLPRLRLLLALILSALLAPILAPALPAERLAAGDLAGLIVAEVTVGLLIGAVTRMAMVALHLGGSIIASQSGLASATFFSSRAARSTSSRTSARAGTPACRWLSSRKSG